MADTDKIRTSNASIWEWARDKVLPFALTGTFLAGVGMYTELRVMNQKLDAMNERDAAQSVRLDDHEKRLRDLERKP